MLILQEFRTLLRASYNGDGNGQCGLLSIPGACGLMDITEDVKAACQGKKNCDFRAENQNIPGCTATFSPPSSKFTEIHYECVCPDGKTRQEDGSCKLGDECPSDFPYVFAGGQKCCASGKECNGNAITNESQCCQAHLDVECPTNVCRDYVDHDECAAEENPCARKSSKSETTF